MKNTYSGLEAIKVTMDAKDQICASGEECLAIVTLTMVNFICIEPEALKQVEYLGDQA